MLDIILRGMFSNADKINGIITYLNKKHKLELITLLGTGLFIFSVAKCLQLQDNEINELKNRISKLEESSSKGE